MALSGFGRSPANRGKANATHKMKPEAVISQPEALWANTLLCGFHLPCEMPRTRGVSRVLGISCHCCDLFIQPGWIQLMAEAGGGAGRYTSRANTAVGFLINIRSACSLVTPRAVSSGRKLFLMWQSPGFPP